MSILSKRKKKTKILGKGINQGIVLSFMIAAAGISLPQIILLSKILKKRALIYFIILLISLYTVLGIIFYYI